jgi:periplasmic protein TonB
MKEAPPPAVTRFQRIGPGLMTGMACIATLVVAAHLLSGGSETPKRRVNDIVKIHIIQPPPPPPPPPPKAERPPEPPRMIRQTPIRQPEVKPERPMERPQAPPKLDNNPPPDLGLDAKGEGPGDNFGLYGHPGGNGFFGNGGNGEGGGSRFGWYAGAIQGQIQKCLRDNEKLATSEYRTSYKIWVSSAGRPRVELISSTGDTAIDSLIRQVLAANCTVQPPPEDLPQPIIIGTRARQGG